MSVPKTKPTQELTLIDWKKVSNFNSDVQLTTKVHVALLLFGNISQMASKCGRYKKKWPMRRRTVCCKCYYYIVTSSTIYYTNIRQHGICLSYMVKMQKVVNGDVFRASVLREMIIKYQSKSVHNSANDKCRENIKIYSSCHFDWFLQEGDVHLTFKSCYCHHPNFPFTSPQPQWSSYLGNNTCFYRETAIALHSIYTAIGFNINQGDILLQFEHVYAVSGRC